MNLPFDNDTRAVEKKLAEKNLRTDRIRNVLIIITIAFAACLIMATTLYFFNSARASRNKASGLYQASITGLDDAEADAIRNDSRVFAGFSYLLGMLDHGDHKVTVRTMDENLMQLAKYPAMNGSLPEDADEVAVTQAFLDREGLSAGIGDSVLLDLMNGERNYTISGILPVSDSNYAVYVSTAYVRKNCENPLYTAYINAQGTDGLPEDSIKAYILGFAGEWGIEARDIDFSTYYFSLIRQRSFEYMTVITFVILIITLACALVIYSLFFVSIIRKTNEYGKLRTIGTTGRQIRRIVIREGRSLSSAAIPIGIIAGAAAGYMLAPEGWNTSTVLAVGGFTAVVMYLCVMLTVRKPAKTASEVTPVEAVRYVSGSEEIITGSTEKLNRSLSAGRLALINFSRNKKKTVLTVASLSICGILLMAGSAYFNSIDPVNMAREAIPYGEVRIELGDYGSQSHNSGQFFELQKDNLLSDNFIRQIAAADGVRDVRVYSGTVLNMYTPTGYENPLLADAFPEERQALLEAYLIEGTADLQKLIQNNGIVIKQMDQWMELFEWEVSIGDRVTVESGSGEKTEATVMGIVDGNIPYGGYELVFMPLQTLSAIMPVENLNYQLLIDTEEGKWQAVREEARKLLPVNARAYITTLNDWMETYQKLLANYRTPVYIFVLFVGIFGAINLLNTLITNVLARKRELGVLQAVGMSSRQISEMLLLEGLLYTSGVFILSVSLGTFTGFLLCKGFSAMSVFGEVSYQFPAWEMAGFFILMLTVQVVFSLISIKQLRKQSLAEQIRELA